MTVRAIVCARAGPSVRCSGVGGLPAHSRAGEDGGARGSSDRYDLARADVYVSCHPYGARARAARAHQWTCRWADVGFYEAGSEPCDGGALLGGTMRLIGVRGEGRFAYRVLNGVACRHRQVRSVAGALVDKEVRRLRRLLRLRAARIGPHPLSTLAGDQRCLAVSRPGPDRTESSGHASRHELVLASGVTALVPVDARSHSSHVDSQASSRGNVSVKTC